MESPLRGLKHVHKVIRHMLDGLEANAKNTDYSNDQQAAALTGQFKGFSEMLNEHISLEDNLVFPVLEEKVPNFIPNYSMDHRGDEEDMKKIGELLGQIAGSSSNEEKTQIGKDTYRHVVALNATSNHHMDKEEQLAVPLLIKHLSESEQWGLLETIYQKVPIEMMETASPLIMSLLTQDERELELRIEMRAMTPDMFKVSVAHAPEGMLTEEWKDLTNRIPELASISR